MENLITKELLSEVMGYPLSNNIYEYGITRVIGLNEWSLDLEFGYQGLESSHGRYINVYQLSNKCKEWVNKQSSENLGYAIKTVHYGNNVVGGFVGIKDSYIDDCKTEYELVFKLCQWILENKGIK